MDSKVDKIIRIPCAKQDDLFQFFQYWMAFLRPIHSLNANGILVSACFLKHRYVLSKIIQDEGLLDKTLMSIDEKRQIREECKLSNANFSIILKDLKTKKIIIDGKINPKFIPKIPQDKNMFQMLILFDFNTSS